MGKLSTILILCSMVMSLMSMVVAQGIDQSPEAVEQWFNQLGTTKETVTKLHFYFHDIQSGNNPTSVKVAQASNTGTSPTFFGQINVIDDPLTIGPEPNSEPVGRARGLFGLAGLNEVSLLLTMNLVFPDGSTLSVLGHNPVLHNYREMPIVGGTGIFRLARGVATAKTYSLNVTTGDAVVEYHVVVNHY